MSRIDLEEPVRIKYIIKTDDMDAFNDTVADLSSNRFPYLRQGGNPVNGMTEQHFWYDMEIISIDPEDVSFKTRFPGRSRPIIYNVMTDWQGFYVEFPDGKKFTNLGVDSDSVQTRDERAKFYEYVKHYIEMPEEYIELDDLVL